MQSMVVVMSWSIWAALVVGAAAAESQKQSHGNPTVEIALEACLHIAAGNSCEEYESEFEEALNSHLADKDRAAMHPHRMSIDALCESVEEIIAKAYGSDLPFMKEDQKKLCEQEFHPATGTSYVKYKTKWKQRSEL